MLGSLLDAVAELAPAGVLILIALAGRGFARWPFALAFVALYFGDAVLLNLRDWSPWPPVMGGAWNWDGKAAALALALAAIVCLPAGVRGEIGLARAPERGVRGRLWLIGLIVVGIAAARTLAFSGHQPFDPETLAFQATMPGLHEELTFRGLWWVLLLPVLDGGRAGQGRLPWGTLAVTTILFGSVHAIDLTPAGAFSFNALFFAATAVSGLLYGLLQAIGRCVWVPVIAHAAANLAIVLVQMLVL
ncbi:MAG: CPBP family glutamic-type intramembrane protease [Micropepsaceae bacterium]